MKIYIGGRISGLEYEEVVSYFRDTKERLESMGYEVFTPRLDKGVLRNDANVRGVGYNNPEATNHAVFERDKWFVQNSDVFYLNLANAGGVVSIGGMMELAWASFLGKHTIVCMPKNNIHNHAFVLEAADVVFDDHEKAMSYLYYFNS